MEEKKTSQLDLSGLKPAKGSVHSYKRVGRGIGSGKGRTSARGLKGAKSRSGFKNKRNFEGGQMPLQMRIPKRGFKNRNRVVYVPINLERITEVMEKYNVKDISPENLVANGIVSKNDRIKILGNGEAPKGLTVTAHAFSASARQAIEAAGGTVNLA